MSKERILVVEDEEDILELVRYNLSREGYQVICATSGEKALKIARSEALGLIVLDLMLPGIDGLEVTKMNINYKIVICIVTNYIIASFFFEPDTPIL